MKVYLRLHKDKNEIILKNIFYIHFVNVGDFKEIRFLTKNNTIVKRYNIDEIFSYSCFDEKEEL